MKFLTDAQTPKRFGDMLRSLGYQVDTVYQHGLSKEKDDAKLVSWARAFGYVFITFDQLRHEQGVKVARELKRRGGKVIVMHGRTGEAPERSLGKLLFHWPDWFPLLSKQHGRIDILDTKQAIRWVSRAEINRQVYPAGEEPFDPYLGRVAHRTRRVPKRRLIIPNEQSDFDIDLDDMGTQGA